MKKTVLFALLVQISTLGLAGTNFVPESIRLEIADLTTRFNQALISECPGDICYSRGCSPTKHKTTIDKNGFLAPGITALKPEEVIKQHHLVTAKCSFVYEEILAGADLSNLRQRLAAKIATEGVQVKLATAKLHPKAATTSPTVDLPLKIQAWQEIRPHLYWMIGLILTTLCLVVLAWAFRRPSFAPELTSEGSLLDDDDDDVPSEAIADKTSASAITNNSNLHAKQQLTDRIENTPEIWTNITTSWLLSEDYTTLASAVRYLNDSVCVVPQEKHLLPQRLRFHGYLSEEGEVLAERDFYTAVSTYWQAYCQLDSDTVSISQILYLYSPLGLATELQTMPTYLAKVTLSFMDRHELVDVCDFLPSNQRISMLHAVLSSDRSSVLDLEETMAWLKSVLKGGRITVESLRSTHESRREHEGVKLYVHNAAAILLESLTHDQRQSVLDSLSGHPMKYWQSIFYTDMLNRLPDAVLSQAIVELHADSLAIWLRSLKDRPLNRRILSLAPKLVRDIFQGGESGNTSSEKAREQVERGFSKFISKKSASGDLEFVNLLG